MTASACTADRLLWQFSPTDRFSYDAIHPAPLDLAGRVLTHLLGEPRHDRRRPGACPAAHARRDEHQVGTLKWQTRQGGSEAKLVKQ